MSNTLTYPPLIMSALDAQLLQKATSGWMQDNAGQIAHVGGKEIKVPTRKMTGLGAYDSETGTYPKGNITTQYKLLTLTQDRGSEFYFDRNDVDESGYLTEATSVMSQFQTDYVIPEIDAYRYSKIYQTALSINNTRSFTPKADNILTNLMTDMLALQDSTGIDLDQMVITMPYPILFHLEMSTEMTKSLSVEAFNQGGVDLQLKTLNGATIIPVSSNRMKTAYTYYTGLNGFGFKAATDAKLINWLITPRQVPIALSKTDSLKIFSPEVNQDGDGWKTQYRVYHDLFILENQAKTVYANIAE